MVSVISASFVFLHFCARIYVTESCFNVIKTSFTIFEKNGSYVQNNIHGCPQVNPRKSLLHGLQEGIRSFFVVSYKDGMTDCFPDNLKPNRDEYIHLSHHPLLSQNGQKGSCRTAGGGKKRLCDKRALTTTPQS